jgi:hypothetical protein
MAKRRRPVSSIRDLSDSFLLELLGELNVCHDNLHCLWIVRPRGVYLKVGRFTPAKRSCVHPGKSRLESVSISLKRIVQK